MRASILEFLLFYFLLLNCHANGSYNPRGGVVGTPGKSEKQENVGENVGRENDIRVT